MISCRTILDSITKQTPRYLIFWDMELIEKPQKILKFDKISMAGCYYAKAFPLQNMQFNKNIRPQTQFVMLENSTHNPYLEEP